MFHTLFIALWVARPRPMAPYRRRMLPTTTARALPVRPWTWDCSWEPMIGKTSERAVDQVLVQLLVVAQDVAEDGREQHQEREEGEKAVVGDNAALLPA